MQERRNSGATRPLVYTTLNKIEIQLAKNRFNMNSCQHWRFNKFYCLKQKHHKQHGNNSIMYIRQRDSETVWGLFITRGEKDSLALAHMCITILGAINALCDRLWRHHPNVNGTSEECSGCINIVFLSWSIGSFFFQWNKLCTFARNHTCAHSLRIPFLYLWNHSCLYIIL